MACKVASALVGKHDCCVAPKVACTVAPKVPLKVAPKAAPKVVGNLVGNAVGKHSYWYSPYRSSSFLVFLHQSSFSFFVPILLDHHSFSL